MQYGIYTMGDIACQSERNEELLYDLFGVNAELLIDHAWGWEPCTIEMVKAYKSETNSFSNGQVLQEPYTTKKHVWSFGRWPRLPLSTCSTKDWSRISW